MRQLPDGAQEVARLLPLLGHDDVQDGLDLVRDLEQVEGELLDRPAARDVFERMVDGERREDHVAFLHILHRPARPGLHESLAGRGGRAQIHADVLAEPGAPAHLEDLVVVLPLDAHLLVHLPLRVLR